MGRVPCNEAGKWWQQAAGCALLHCTTLRRRRLSPHAWLNQAAMLCCVLAAVLASSPSGSPPSRHMLVCLLQAGLRPSPVSYNALISACERAGQVDR